MTEDAKKAKVRIQIDENLKRVYEEALMEEVPDRFKLLLEQLRNNEKSGGGSQ